jgi:LacI family transcriptional regulator
MTESSMVRAKKQTTIQDIADACGLSKTIVSYVLSNAPNCRISDAKRKLIHKTVKRLGYRPNFAARSLSLKKYHTIGLLFHSIRNYVYTELLANIQKRLSASNYATIFDFWEAPEESPKAFDAVLSRGVDGIITCHEDHSLIPPGFPAVLLHSSNPKYDSIVLERTESLREATNYLLDLGHSAIGTLCLNMELYGPIIRECFRERGIKFDNSFVYGGHGYSEDGYKAMRQLLAAAKRPTALICCNDTVAIGGIAAAGEAGLRLPEEMSFIGSDNIQLGRFSNPSLTSCGVELDELAGKLVELMLRRLNTPEAEILSLIIPQKLFIRNSTVPTHSYP